METSCDDCLADAEAHIINNRFQNWRRINLPLFIGKAVSRFAWCKLGFHFDSSLCLIADELSNTNERSYSIKQTPHTTCWNCVDAALELLAQNGLLSLAASLNRW